MRLRVIFRGVSSETLQGAGGREKPPLALGIVRWLPSHRAPVVLRSSSLLGLGVSFLSLAGVGFFGLLGVRLILGVVVQEGFAAC